MQRAFSSLLVLAALACAAPAAAAPLSHLRPAAEGPKDTIVVRLPNQAVLTLLVRDAAQLRELKNYHLDSLTTQLASYIAQAEAAAKASKSEQVTMDFYPAKDQPGRNLPEQVRITASKNNPNANRVDVGVGKGLNLKIKRNGGGNFSISTGNERNEENREERQARRDSSRYANRNKAHSTEFRFDIGLNALVNKGSYATAPGLEAGRLELRPEGSRYVNLGVAHVQRLGGKGSPVFLSLGPEFAFNNYMLQGNNRWVSLNERTEIVRETTRQLEKTKLATTTVNLPLMLGVRLHDRRGRPTLLLGGGGFVGYLIGQHSKIKYTENGDTHKDKDRGSFNLNEFQYGLQGTVGFGNFTLFTKYNMNELFKENRGPQTNVLSFGVTLSGI